jgi:hypothetical protein
VNPAISEHVSKSVTMVVGTGDSVDACASKKTRKNMPFLCSVTAVTSDELAVLLSVGAFWGCETTSLEVGRLA